MNQGIFRAKCSSGKYLVSRQCASGQTVLCTVVVFTVYPMPMVFVYRRIMDMSSSQCCAHRTPDICDRSCLYVVYINLNSYISYRGFGAKLL